MLKTKLVRTWMCEVLGGATGGFHDGQLKPRSSGRPGGMSEDGSMVDLRRHFESGSGLRNSQGADSARNHGWVVGPGGRGKTTRLEEEAEHSGDVCIVDGTGWETRWEWGWG